MPEYVFDRGDAASARVFASLDSFTQGYIEAAFWLGSEEEKIPEDSFSNLAPEALATMQADCASFQQSFRGLLDQTDADDHRHGVDFWLTRNGHGAGFWDRGYGAVGDELTKMSKPYGESDLYRGDNGKIYHYPGS